jgi:hypothetical protein
MPAIMLVAEPTTVRFQIGGVLLAILLWRNVKAKELGFGLF